MRKPTVSVILSGAFDSAEDALQYLKREVNAQHRFNTKIVILGTAYAVYSALKISRLNREIEELKNVKEG